MLMGVSVLFIVCLQRCKSTQHFTQVKVQILSEHFSQLNVQVSGQKHT